MRSQKTESQIANLQFLYTYISHIRLTKTIERNLLMAESMKTNLPSRLQERGDVDNSQSKKITKPEDLVRIYDIILQVGKVSVRTCTCGWNSCSMVLFLQTLVTIVILI